MFVMSSESVCVSVLRPQTRSDNICRRLVSTTSGSSSTSSDMVSDTRDASSFFLNR